MTAGQISTTAKPADGAVDDVDFRLIEIRGAIAAVGSTPLAAALGCILSRPEIAIGLVGVTSRAELDQILAAAAQPMPALDWATLALDDEMVLTPSRW